MAHLFELAANCGNNRQAAFQFGEAFEGVGWALADTTPIECRFSPSDVWLGGDQSWWCRVVPDGASFTGVLAPKVSAPERLVELARLLYAHLSGCPFFRFARVGWEVEESLDAEDWARAIRDISTFPPGVVICGELWQQLGCPSRLEPFGSERYWIPLSDSDYLNLVKGL